MAAAYRSIGTTTYAARTTCAIPAPAGIVDGDILVLVFVALGSRGSHPPAATMPSGFSTLQTGSTHDESNPDYYVDRYLAYKVASGESGSYTVTYGGSSVTCQGVVVCVSGGTSVGLVSSDSADDQQGTTSTATGVTTPTDNSCVIFFDQNWVLWSGATAPTGTTPTFTERYDSADSLIYVATGVLATAGATGNKTQANNNATGTDGWGAFLVGVGQSGAAGSVVPVIMNQYRQRRN